MELRDVEMMTDGLAFPEGPIAVSDGSVIVVQLLAGCLSSVAPDGTIRTIAELGGGPNGAAIGPDGAIYVCNNGGTDPSTQVGGSIQRVDVATGAFKTLYTSCGDTSLRAPNDLVFDESGNFYFTDFSHMGAIYYASPDGASITSVVPTCSSPNGIGLSPDGTVLYWAETHTRQVQRRRVVSPGRLAESPGYNIRALFFGGELDAFALLAGLPNNHELDSLAIDSSGAVCVGTLVDSGISEIAEDGTWTLHTLPAEFADGAVTNIAFGGEDLTTAYITCSITGRLLKCRWHRRGLKLHFNL